MTELSAEARAVRGLIMEQLIRDGTAPSNAELSERLSLPAGTLPRLLRDLEGAGALAVQQESHAHLTHFQGEPIAGPLPPPGEAFYARPFATFKNHYPVWVDGEQRWYAECAVEACAVSAMFPGKEVIVRSLCRQTKESVELIGRDGHLLRYSPRTLRVQVGFPAREGPKDVLGWCDYNSFFASEDAAQTWRRSHPEIQGRTYAPLTMARLVTEFIGKGRLDYDYQVTVPLLKMPFNLKRWGLSKPTWFGLHVPDPFWMPTPEAIAEWKRQGYGSFIRVSAF